MPALRDHIPLAIVTIALSVAVFILFKEVKAAKEHAVVGARFAASFQEQQQQQLLVTMPHPQAAFLDEATVAAQDAPQATPQAAEPRAETRRVTIKEEIEEIPDELHAARRPSGKRTQA